MLHTEAQQVQHHSHGVAANVLHTAVALPWWRLLLLMLLLLLLLLLAARSWACPLTLACCLQNNPTMLQLAAMLHQRMLALQLPRMQGAFITSRKDCRPKAASAAH